MFTYQVIVHPNGKHLFTTDIRDEKPALQVYADMVNYYGKQAVTLTKWSCPMGTDITPKG